MTKCAKLNFNQINPQAILAHLWLMYSRSNKPLQWLILWWRRRRECFEPIRPFPWVEIVTNCRRLPVRDAGCAGDGGDGERPQPDWSMKTLSPRCCCYCSRSRCCCCRATRQQRPPLPPPRECRTATRTGVAQTRPMTSLTMEPPCFPHCCCYSRFAAAVVAVVVEGIIAERFCCCCLRCNWPAGCRKSCRAELR